MVAMVGMVEMVKWDYQALEDWLSLKETWVLLGLKETRISCRTERRHKRSWTKRRHWTSWKKGDMVDSGLKGDAGIPRQKEIVKLLEERRSRGS